MAEQKTKPTDENVDAFLDAIDDDARRADAKKLVVLLERWTGHPPKMWGASIIGFGEYHYRYASGHEGDAALIGFAPRKNAHVLYLAQNLEGKENLIEKLGPVRTGKGCLYIKRLSDVDEKTLKQLVIDSVNALKRTYS